MLDPLLWWFWLFRLLCIIGLSACMASNLFFIFNSAEKSSYDSETSFDGDKAIKLGIRDYFLHLYAAALCLGGIVAELELSCMKVYAKFLQIWAFRGLFYIFIGILTSSSAGETFHSHP